MTGLIAPTKPEHASWTMREKAHLNGGKVWFGYIYQCIQQPRLTRLDRYTRKDRSVTSTWRVDGQDVASFDEALEELQFTPQMTCDELDAVVQFDRPEMAKSDFADFGTVSEVLHGSMSAKGLVWWQRGRVSLRIEALLDAIGSTESNASGNPSFDRVGPRASNARAAVLRARAASADTHPQGGDVKQAPFMGGAVPPAGDAQ